MQHKSEEIFLTVKKGQLDILKDGLARLPEAHLRRIAAYWLGSQVAMISPQAELLSDLKEAMSDAGKQNAVLDRLPKRSYDLLYYVYSEGGALSFAEIRSGFPVRDKKDLREILQHLIVRGLIWELRTPASEEDSTGFHLLGTLTSNLTLPSFLEGKLGRFLPSRSKEQLRTLVEALGGDFKQLSKDRETIPWLKAQLRNPVRLRRLFESFDLNERRLLKILSLRPQGVTSSRLYYEFSLFVNKDPQELLPEILKNLDRRCGLLEVQLQPIEEGVKRAQESHYRLPREIAYIIRHNFKEKYHDEFLPIAIFRSPDEDFALASRSKERSNLWIDFQQLLNHLVRCEVGVIRKGGMHKKNLKRILDRLAGHPEDAYHYLDFLFLYAYERKILYPDGERWKIQVPHLLPLQTETAFVRDFWAFYRHNASWNDRDSSPLQGVLQKGDSPQVFSLRRALLRLLCDCPLGQWIEMKIFFDQLMDREMVFRTSELPFITQDPLREKYRFMKSTLERSLSWLGIVDTTVIASRRTDLFRLTDIGAWLLMGKPEHPPFSDREEVDTFTIQNNLELIIPATLPLERQLYLARFTDDHKGRILITRASIRRGLEGGLSAREMLDFLQEYCSNPMPPNIAHLIEEVVEKTGNIFIGGESHRLEVSDQVLLDELLEQKRFLPFIQERSDAKQAILRRGTDLEKLVEELREAGYAPRML